MDNRWFKEDRKLPKEEQGVAIEKSKTALKAATLINRRLRSILQEMMAQTYIVDEDTTVAGWERIAMSNASRRKALREIDKLLDF
jgi:hypothetical protein